MRKTQRIAAVTLALLAAAQLAGCNSDDKPASTPAPSGDTSGGGAGTGGGGTGDTGGDTGGTSGGDTGGGAGGGNTGGDTGGGTGGTPGAMAEGFFIDAAVAGLNYTTSSDLSGLTDAEGRYEYREGDTVTFSIGGLQLGTVVAQGVVTPVTVAQALTSNTTTSAETVAINLLVLLQSLDADGDPDNGITFTAGIRDAVDANSLDLTAAESAFTSSLTAFVTSVAGEAGVTLTPVDRADAVAHFVAQSPTALAGSYVRANENFEPITQKAVTLTVFRSGRYLLGGQYDLASCNLDGAGTPDNSLVFSDADGNGVEYGSYSWDPLTNEFEVTGMIRETDGFCGFNEPIADATNDIAVLEPHAKGLVFKDSDGNVAHRFARVQREPTTLAGPWLAPNALLLGQPFTFTFFPSSADGLSGRYLMVDASLPNPEAETSPGIEEGCYSVDAQDNLTVELNASVCTNAVDTNDTAGASSTPTGMQLFIDENDRLVIADGAEVTGLTRLPLRAVTHEAMAGSWTVESAPGVAPAEETNLAMLTVFEDGRFLFGTQENDASCVPVDYPTLPLDAEGNGVEYGLLSLTHIPGLVVPTTVTVDTNGECGLYHNGKTMNGNPFTQAYFVAPNAAGDALMVWVNDEEDPAGLVFKRVRSVTNQIWGAWQWTEDGADEGQFAISAYFEGGPEDGVMFEVSTLPDNDAEAMGVGILRESFTYDGTTMRSHNAGYEYCVDTQGTQDECVTGDAETPIVEEYVVNGDIIGDEEEGGVMTRIPSPVTAP